MATRRTIMMLGPAAAVAAAALLLVLGAPLGMRAQAAEFGLFETQWEDWPGEHRQERIFPEAVGAEVLPAPPGEVDFPPRLAKAVPPELPFAEEMPAVAPVKGKDEPPQKPAAPLQKPAEPPQKPAAPPRPAATVAAAPQPAVAPTRAESGLLTVYVPLDVKLTINGLPTSATGSRRPFVSYGLKPGFGYKYNVVAEGVREGRRVRQYSIIAMTAGDRTAVVFDFSPPSAGGLGGEESTPSLSLPGLAPTPPIPATPPVGEPPFPILPAPEGGILPPAPRPRLPDVPEKPARDHVPGGDLIPMPSTLPEAPTPPPPTPPAPTPRTDAPAPSRPLLPDLVPEPLVPAEPPK